MSIGTVKKIELKNYEVVIDRMISSLNKMNNELIDLSEKDDIKTIINNLEDVNIVIQRILLKN